MSRNGYLYIGTGYEGIRRVTPDGTIGTLRTLKGSYGFNDRVDALAVDRHGTVYYSVLGIQQVTAVVRADAVELPTDNPFPWSALLWGAVALAVLAAASWWFLRRRAATNANHEDHSGQKDDTVHSGEEEPAELPEGTGSDEDSDLAAEPGADSEPGQEPS